ncbi:hypothetical protein LR48_Vigan10g274100 [Vigna angularis]|uniref:F-box domain-containing protein n=1 Tax=Phaseolus angularis TaxID=3914 RepID=A0A0L9VQ20_PHAAN|nr:F-box/FBD/LRR-repeat protein At4g26340 [Vigna angularis]KOM56849.1 hypothetical protein LR48_Vigan10g274100 [Vigna angularis]
MADMISSFPDDILCYILSFLPSNEVVATSVLSKRWYRLWRWVHSFDFDYHIRGNDKNKEAYYPFLLSMLSFLAFRRLDQPLHRFRLRCHSKFHRPVTISILTSKWINDAVSEIGRVQHLDLNLNLHIAMPSVVFSCKTLVVLKLANITLKDVSFVDLPLLKILHLRTVYFSEGLGFTQLLSGTPNLEDLEAINITVNPEGKFNRLPKLVRAKITGILFSLEIVNNVKVLPTNWLMHLCQQDLVFEFHNLVELKLNLPYIQNWIELLETLKHCPKLQTLAIRYFKTSFGSSAEGQEEAVWTYPESVPACISSHLKTCRLENYRGSIDEFRFARYIMQNATYLRTMKIKICTYNNSTHWEKFDMKRDLSSCIKNSDTCKLSFE